MAHHQYRDILRMVHRVKVHRDSEQPDQVQVLKEFHSKKAKTRIITRIKN